MCLLRSWRHPTGISAHFLSDADLYTAIAVPSHCDVGVSKAFQTISPPLPRKATTLAEALLWYHFVPASGPDGRDWYDEYRRSGWEALSQRIDVSVDLMRRRKIDAGKALLDECRGPLEAPEVRSSSRAVAGVVEEAFFGALAYFHYHRGQFDAARDALDRAADLIAEVVADAPCLITFTTKCYDFCLHRARIARSEALWQEMWTCVQQGREMLTGERPLCCSDHGAMYIGDAEAFFQAATPADDIERRALDLLRDRDSMIATYEKRALGATMPPGVVVDY